MREADGILDFLEEYDLLRPPEDDGAGDPRTGRIGQDDVVVEVDWEALVTPDFHA